MRLAVFIRANIQPITVEWENFARTLLPAAASMSPLALRNHAPSILEFIADDIESAQSNAEQIEKSHGEKPKSSIESVAEIHADLRRSDGFNLDQMVSEYRALRASVIKLWRVQRMDVTDLDIADLIRFNEAIDQALTESITRYTKKLDYSRNLFLGILSHDLRNPLGITLMSAQLALKTGTLNEKQTKLVSRIVKSTQRATEILNHLLDLTRVRLGSGIAVSREQMDLGAVCWLLVDEIRVMHPQRMITLKISGDTVGEWDKPRIGQVFSNLLGNAIQYGWPDSPISVIINGQPEEVRLAVHNHGNPIAPDVIGTIFDSLIRGEDEAISEHEPRSINLGLGLYIAKEIVYAHGGTIDVTSSAAAGTTFTARFPRSG